MMMTYFLPEKKPAGDVNPAMFSLQILALSTPTAAGSTNDPDHGLETILDGGEVHADPLYPGHGGDQLSPRPGGKENPREFYQAGQDRSGQRLHHCL